MKLCSRLAAALIAIALIPSTPLSANDSDSDSDSDSGKGKGRRGHLLMEDLLALNPTSCTITLDSGCCGDQLELNFTKGFFALAERPVCTGKIKTFVTAAESQKCEDLMVAAAVASGFTCPEFPGPPVGF